MTLQSRLTEALALRIPGDNSTAVRLRAALLESCQTALDAALLDAGALGRLCGTDDGLYWGAMSEVLLADKLVRAGLQPAHQEPGPDFRIEHGGKTIWIEAITPLPSGVPCDWLNHSTGVVDFPAEALLLRWTAAIKEKAQKLLGRPGDPGYLAKGIVQTEDAYVIAVNGLLLRMGGGGQGDGLPQLEGISQLPLAVEATCAVGPYAMRIDRNTLASVSAGHSHRPEIIRQSRPAVPADTFYDEAFNPVSAIWAADVGYMSLLGNDQPMAVIHNPGAVASVPLGLLPSQEEFTLEIGEEELHVHRHAGREPPRRNVVFV